jgi:hypothetical protein
MEVIGRAFFVLAGMAAGAATALIVLPILILFDPLAGHISLISSIGGFVDLLQRAFEDMPPDEAMTIFAGFLWTAALMVCVVPLVITALIGEIAAVRSLIWYCGGTGALSAAMPWLVRATYHLTDARSAKPLELRFALLFFLTGTAAGFIYWLICGRRAGLRPAAAKRNSLS